MKNIDYSKILEFDTGVKYEIIGFGKQRVVQEVIIDVCVEYGYKHFAYLYQLRQLPVDEVYFILQHGLFELLKNVKLNITSKKLEEFLLPKGCVEITDREFLTFLESTQVMADMLVHVHEDDDSYVRKADETAAGKQVFWKALC